MELNSSLKDQSTALHDFAKEFSYFSITTLLSQASRFFTAVLIARFIGPARFGVWNALQPILMYGVVLFLGVPNAMNRDVPFLMGQGNNQEAQSVVNITFAVILIASFIGSLLLLIISRVSFIPISFSKPLVFMAILFIAMNLYGFFSFFLKSNIQFKLMSHQQLIFSIIWPICCLLSAYLFQLEGYIFGQSVAFFLICAYIYRTSRMSIANNFQWSLLVPLIKRGFPIMTAGILKNMLSTADRWIILVFLGIEALGQYSIAILVMGVLSLLPQVIAQQFYPRMALAFGKSCSTRHLVRMILIQSLLSFSVTLPVVAAAYLFLPTLVPILLPKFIEGVHPARIILLGVVMLPLTGGVANFLNTIGKQLYYLVNQVGALLLNIALGTFFVHIGWGLNGVALSTSMAWIMFTVSMIITGMIFIKRMSTSARVSQ